VSAGQCTAYSWYPGSKEMRILVVEDEKRIADFLTRGLQGAGYAVDAAPNGLIEKA
jgi:CheY-like chemotaxis protein